MITYRYKITFWEVGTGLCLYYGGGHILHRLVKNTYNRCIKLFLNCGKIHIKFTILSISRVQFSDIKYINIVVPHHQDISTELFHLAKLKVCYLPIK